MHEFVEKALHYTTIVVYYNQEEGTTKEDKDMIRTEIKTYTEREQREVERKLQETGYNKIADCMWAKIYTKNNNEIVVNREW